MLLIVEALAVPASVLLGPLAHPRAQIGPSFVNRCSVPKMYTLCIYLPYMYIGMQYVHVRLYIRIQVYIDTHTNVHTYVYMQMCRRIQMQTYEYAREPVHAHRNTYVYIYTRRYLNANAYSHGNTHQLFLHKHPQRPIQHTGDRVCILVATSMCTIRSFSQEDITTPTKHPVQSPKTNYGSTNPKQYGQKYLG